jgi:hypothetical protein
MPDTQNTFTVVPNGMGLAGQGMDTPQTKPPMTSKQAQKLYRQATRGPKMTKAEARRLEKEEQDRIKKELETTKARAARERKKQKDLLKGQKEREEKKRKGLPLVNVRPSQDTLARFVRGNGGGMKRDRGDLALAAIPEGKENQPPALVQDEKLPCQGIAKKQKIGSQLKTPEQRKEPRVSQPRQQAVPSRDDGFSGDEDDVDRMASTQLLTELLAASSSPIRDFRLEMDCLATMSGKLLLPAESQQVDSPLPASEDSRGNIHEHTKNTICSKPIQSDAVLVGPPSKSANRPDVANMNSTADTFKLPPRSTVSCPATQHTVASARISTALSDEALPTSTQFLVINYLDDLFPSASQQARELLESELPQSNSDAADDLVPFLSTQDLVLSLQDVLDLEHINSSSNMNERDSEARRTMETTSAMSTENKNSLVQSIPASTWVLAGEYEDDMFLGVDGIGEEESSVTLSRSQALANSPMNPEHQKTDKPASVLENETTPEPNSTSKPKRRFFTSSGRYATEKLNEYKAVQESMATFRQEEQARRRARREAEKAANEVEISLEPQGEGREEEAARQTTAGDIKDCVLTWRSHDFPKTTGKAAENIAKVSAPPAASQETDYGDFDFDEAGLLDGTEANELEQPCQNAEDALFMDLEEDMLEDALWDELL